MKASVRLCVLTLILLTIGFRIVHLNADPPANFGWSGGYFADEGYWSHNARNQALFGSPVLDEWNASAMSPLFVGIQSLVFRFFGAGLIQVRLIGILSSIALAVVSFFLFRKQFSVSESYLMSLFVSLSYPMIVLGRQGILDPFACALAWVAVLLLMSGTLPGAFFCGMFLVAACTSKYLMVYTLAPIAFAVYSLTGSTNEKIRMAAAVFVGALAAFLLWFFSTYSPHHELIAMYGKYYSSQQDWHWKAVVQNILEQPFYLYFAKTPAILFLGNLVIWWFLTTFKSAGKIDRVCWVWVVVGILFFALWKYRPERYYTSLLPPLACLAGVGLIRFEQLAQSFQTQRSTRLLLWAGMLVPAAQFSFLVLDDVFHWQIVPAEVRSGNFDAIVFLFLTAAGMVILASKVEMKWMVFAVVLAFLLGDLRSFTTWTIHPSYQAEDVAADLQQRVGSGVIAGQWAPEMCLENRVRVVPVWHGFVNSEDPIRKYGITHLLLWRYPLGDEVQKFQEWYPEEFKQFTEVKEYTIKNSTVVLFEKKETAQRQGGM